MRVRIESIPSTDGYYARRAEFEGMVGEAEGDFSRRRKYMSCWFTQDGGAQGIFLQS